MQSKLPKWYREIQKNLGDKPIKYEYIRDAYTYLRSIRKLLGRQKQLLTLKSDIEIRIQLNHIFTEQGFQSILDVKKITHSLTKIGLGPDKTFIQKKEKLRIKTNNNTDLHPNIEARLKAFMKHGQKQSAASEWKWRIQTTIQDTVIENKWYPLFGTYTVDPAELQALKLLTRDDLWKDKKLNAWNTFIRKYKTEIADSLGYGRKPSKWPKTSTFFQYFAVIEHGKTGKHPHIHVIFLCKNIPKTWKKDPNINCPTNTEMDIPIASTLWIYGRQKITQAIFINGSPFIDNLGWSIPKKYDEKTQKLETIKVSDAKAVGGYIAKYLGKGTETKKWNHRVKCTKNLGITTLKKKLQTLNCIPILTALALRPPQFRTMFQMQKMTSCPLSLLRRISKRELMKRWHSSTTQQGEQSIWKAWTQTSNTFYMKLIDSVSSGLRPWSQTPEQRYNHCTLIMEEVNDTAHSNKILIHLKKYLDILITNTVSSKPTTRLQPKLAT